MTMVTSGVRSFQVCGWAAQVTEHCSVTRTRLRSQTCTLTLLPRSTQMHFRWIGYVKEIRLGFYNHDKVDIDSQDVDQVLSAIHQDWRAGRRVLVRCQAGWNRSGLIMGLVLMREGMSAQEVIDLTRDSRS